MVAKQLKVTVGIDFGTSTTKIAYHVFGEHFIEPVLFNHGLMPSYPEYCLPSVADFDKKGNLVLGCEAAQHLVDQRYDSGIHRMKMILAGRYSDEFLVPADWKQYRAKFREMWKRKKVLKPEILVTAYVSYAMRKAEAVLRDKYPQSEYELQIQYYVCMPVHHYKSENVRSIFEKVLAAAQDLNESMPSGSRPTEDYVTYIEKRWSKIKYDGNSEGTRVFFKPETMAQIASYRFSSARRNGIHVLVDIGAGTTDVCILELCNVKRKGEKTYCYAWDNIPVGAGKFEKVIAKTLEQQNMKPTQEMLYKVIQSPNVSKGVNELLEDGVSDIWKQTRCAWGRGYRFGRDKRQIVANEWYKDNLNVFLCGGGASLPYVMKQFKESPISPQKSTPWGPHPIDFLPCPERDYRQDVAPFQRMAVAYGLAHPELLHFDLEPETLPPLEAPPVRQCGEYDGDILLPGSNWV